MNNNKIGSNVIIRNSIIFPYFEDSGNLTATIGDNTLIGGNQSSVKNAKYPVHIYNGITVLGINAMIPGDTVIEQGVFIDSNMPVKELKKHKIMKKGTGLYMEK